MSYNIDTITIIVNRDLRIPVERYEELRSRWANDAPAVSIFDRKWSTWSADGKIINKIVGDVPTIRVGAFWWNGEGSGRSTDLLERVLVRFDGAADFVLTWEGGNSLSGLRLVDGVVTEHDVVQALGAPRVS